MINYANEEIEFNGCPGCAYANHEFDLPCGIAYENERFILSQDWELPIQGFFVVSPKRCVDNFSVLTTDEKIEMFDIVDKTITILKENNICDNFNVIFEEKDNIHFHVWIMPRHKWMSELVGGITKNIGDIFDYATSNLRNEDNYNRINEINLLVKNAFEEYVEKSYKMK